ncbi:MAG: hypothetical protein C3F07_13305 [Anaerolineales bacterium]|nr:MAG: hypothetical protein C3F07_13305 [Anaerolineales bacterium]
MFILPGALLYILLGRGDDSPFGLCEVLPVGFALSVAIASLIGILGRALGFSFLVVRIIFALSGLGVLALLMLHKPNLDLRRLGLVDSIRGLVTNIPLLLALLLATSVAFNGYQFFIDDTSYGAYLMNWRHSAHLGFFNIVHQMNVAEQSRFWLALYPMGQALLADLSGIPGVLLLSNYLELFLVPLAVVTAYWFARVLGLSRRMAGVSVLVQILFYVLMIDESWPVGFWFFQNMAEDKVSATFLLAPVLFSFILKFLQSPNRNNLTLAFLIGIGLMLTHPVILFLACVVSAGLAGIAWLLGKTDWWKLLQLAVIFILLLLPYVAIRRFDRYSQAIPFDAESVITTFQAERYVNVINDRFYGLNPETLMLLNIPQESGFYPAFQIFRLVPVVLLLFALILALLKIKDGPLYWYVAACILLVAFAAIPYTGWALGYFISARMMSRVAWFSPLGLAGALAIKLILGRPLKRFSSASPKTLESGSKKSDEFAKSVVTGLAAVGILAFSVLLPNVSTYFATLDHNRQLAQVGAFIDQSTDGPTTVIALDYADIQMLPSVSAHASLISFREEKEYNPHNYFMPAEEIRRRMDASNTIRSLDPSIPEDKRCALLDEYQVQFVLAGNGNAEQFTDLTGACRRNFTVSYRTADIILLQSR